MGSNFSLYRASAVVNAIELEPVPVSPDSLDPRYVFLLDAGDTIWIWSGRKAKASFVFNMYIAYC